MVTNVGDGLGADEQILDQFGTIIECISPDLRSLIDDGPDTGMIFFDAALRIRFVAGSVTRGMGLEMDRVEQRLLTDVLAGAEVEAAARAALRGDRIPVDGDFNGRLVRQLLGPLTDSDGCVVGGAIILFDITADRDQERRLRESEEQFRVAFTSAPIGMALLGIDGRFLRVNSALCRIFGYEPGDLTRLGILDIVHPDDVGAFMDQVEHVTATDTRAFQLEQRCFDAHGHVVCSLASVAVFRAEDGHPLHLIAHIEDISERKRHEEDLRRQAELDTLTGVYNRRRFETELARHRALVARFGHRCAVVLIDVDGLKAVNDSDGHLAGDALLREVAGTISKRVRETDLFARLGGDEFGLILENVGPKQARAVAVDLVQLVARRCGSTISAGVAMLDPTKPGTAMQLSDQGLYEAKACGGNTVGARFPPDEFELQGSE